MSNVISIFSARSASAATPSTAAVPASGDDMGFSAALADAGKRPEGEKTEKVTGHHYEKIVAGSDKGHFINRTGNPRDGEDFQIVQRGGLTFHVYDTAKDHKVYELPHAAKAATGTVPDAGGTPAA
ncbi:MAG TPA: hypothetical protein VFY32_08335 [Solirubrobacteraceae bacterium]|jgi:hypothetical protein|nr:hypothetical protein [Solirubrobacteraceae bacterium]